MDSLRQHIRGDTFSNWLDVAVGISITTKGISDYLEGTVLALHNTIKYGPCAQLPNCIRNCSKTEQNLSTWCSTCTEWKKQIMSYNRFKTRARQIKWKDINSSEWPQNVNELVKVFAPDWWKARNPYTEDLVVALSIFHNCTTFTIPILTCNRVRDVRNALFAHGNLQVHNSEKKRAFKDLIAFLRLPIISTTKSGKKGIRQLKRVKTNSVMELAKEEDAFKRHIVKVLNPRDETERTILAQSHEVKAMKICVQEDKNDRRRLSALLVISMVLVSIYFLTSQYNTGVLIDKRKDCLPLAFSSPCPWTPDIPFDVYLKDRPVLYGREWLIDKIQTSLFATPSRGILLTAEMGYGKSALVQHILCTEECGLRKYILSYHICKFDVISTQKPEYFIKNLAGMLISKLPEAGNAILTNEFGINFLLSSKCSEDPIGCFDAAIIHSLQGLQVAEERYVIIDALDECGDSAAIAISLIDVLSKRISKIPWWLKFFITTRDITMVTDKFSGMKIFHETTQNVQNQHDISIFLTHHLFPQTDTITRLFGAHANIETITNRILMTTGSNFLYADLAVKFWRDSPSSKLSDIPQTFTDFYNTNLDRVFGENPHQYDLARSVFEVLCTSYKQLLLEELEDILTIKHHPYSLRNLLREQMSHFVDFKGRRINIYHKGICDHLSNDTSVLYKYQISKYNGHKLFARYLLGKYNLTRTDVLDMLIHVAESDDLELQHSFKQSQYVSNSKLINDSHLHQMAKVKNSFLGTKLLISVLGKEHINNFTSANVTATFLAAAFGNSETLRALIEEGGDYLFRVSGPPNKGGMEDVVNLCKYKTLWGYGLLDIASQNGHVDVVDLLLSKNQSFLYIKNGLGLTASHLASEHGYIEILSRFLAINSTLADQHALYLASKNGHLACVLSLLDHGAEDTCVTCGDNLHWITNNTKRMQWHPCNQMNKSLECDVSLLLDNEFKNVKFVLNDDERLIKCSTALDIAIQEGHKDIVTQLLSQDRNALLCRNYAGRTPLLTAIQYNQSEILDIILEKGGNLTDKCERFYNSAVRFSHQNLHKNERTRLVNDICPLGAGLEHILAIKGRKEMFKRLYSRGLSFNWTMRDDTGNTPLHYAACNNEWQMIVYMIKLGNVNVHESATNGSLPIHSAVLCYASMSYMALHPHYTNTGKPLEDNGGRGLFHYLVIGSIYKENAINMAYLLMADGYKLNTSTKDTNSNNYLHYAAEIGNHDLILHLVVGLKTPSLLLETNKHNKTAIYVAFEQLPYQHEYRICVNCSMLDLFIRTRNNTVSDDILSKEEIVIYRIFQIIKDYSDIQLKVDFSKYRRLVVEKGNAFLFFSIIMFQPRPAIVPVDKHLLKVFFSATQPSMGMLDILSTFTLDYCEKPFDESLLHRTIRNENNRYWIYWVHGYEFVNVIRSKPLSFWETCYDRDGYNILQHAVMGGNFIALKLLIESGITLDTPFHKPLDLVSCALTNADIFEMDHIMSRIWMKYKTSQFITGQTRMHIYLEYNFYSQTKNFDNTTSYVLSQLIKTKALQFSHVCETKSTLLSLVHQAAIKNHLYLLMAMYKGFGKRVLLCRNTYKFTPLYFAKLFDHSNVIKYLQRKSVSETFPHRTAEFAFLQTFAADNISSIRNIPEYVKFLVGLTHPYLYDMKPISFAIFQRTLTRLCLDAERTFSKSFAILVFHSLAFTGVEPLEESLTYLNETNHFKENKTNVYNLGNEILSHARNASKSLQSIIYLIKNSSEQLVLLHYNSRSLSRNPMYKYVNYKQNGRSLLSLVMKLIRSIHSLHSHQNFMNNVFKTMSTFYSNRLLFCRDFEVNMSFRDIKEFYAFRRQFVKNMTSYNYPFKSDVPRARLSPLNTRGLLSLMDSKLYTLIINIDNPLDKFLERMEALPDPLNDG
ncbi:uncharacterized protein [Argopecten irradians]|uniref:uncharacterized protein isoform X1 n=1 Tax=Argopecten irradians TaxID=31199 RepID=UPI003719F3AB